MSVLISLAGAMGKRLRAQPTGNYKLLQRRKCSENNSERSWESNRERKEDGRRKEEKNKDSSDLTGQHVSHCVDLSVNLCAGAYELLNLYPDP